jgi:hypothetical protein
MRGASRAATLACAALLACALPAAAQTGAAPGGAAPSEAARTLELDEGVRIAYTLRTHAPDAHLLDPAAELKPDSPLATAKLLNRYLVAGDLVEAAALSNAPKRRFEVFRDYRNSVGPDEFKRIFAQYFDPANRLLAEIAIGPHALLIWQMGEATERAGRLAGQYFKEIEGRWLMDDVSSPERSSLRRVLEAYRTGRLP